MGINFFSRAFSFSFSLVERVVTYSSCTPHSTDSHPDPTPVERLKQIAGTWNEQNKLIDHCKIAKESHSVVFGLYGDYK